MKSTEYKRLRKEVLGVSQLSLAGQLQVDEKTVRNREHDVYPISKEAEMAIKYLCWAKQEGASHD